MKRVAIYTTPTCSYCKMTKVFFQEKGIAYEEYNVAADAARRNEMIEKSGQMGVPVIEITNEDGAAEYIIGFNKRELSRSLGV